MSESKTVNKFGTFKKWRINLHTKWYRLKSSLVFNILFGLVGVTALTHGSVYLAYGPDHPRCMSQWKKMKQRGQLNEEMLWKERLIYARRREFLTASVGYGQVEKWKHPRATMGPTMSPQHLP